MVKRLYLAIHVFDAEGTRTVVARSTRFQRELFDPEMVSQSRMRQVASEKLAEPAIGRVFGIVVNRK